MIITTTSVEKRAICEYKGTAFGEVISGVNFIKDFGTDNGMLMITASGTAVVVD
mgnify:CR=1 FL=1